MMQNQEKIELLKKAKGPIDNEFTQLEEIYVILYAISKIVMDEIRHSPCIFSRVPKSSFTKLSSTVDKFRS